MRTTQKSFLCFLLRLIGSAVLCASTWAWASDMASFWAAVRFNDARTLQNLQQKGGLDFNALDEKGTPALVLALGQDSLAAAAFLLAQPDTDLNATNRAGENALMVAALRGHGAMLKALIERGAQVNKVGWTPLHYAATHNSPASRDMVALLLEHSAYIDAESPNQSTPLMMAARYGTPQTVQLLLDEGADLQLKNQKGLTALDFAQNASRPDNVELLNKARLKLNATGDW